MNYVQTEKDVLSIIRHPFIVKLNYAFQNDRHLFLVMDFCNLLYSFSSLGPGGDLSALLFLKKKI
jgi:serine/threonine protein kinase